MDAREIFDQQSDAHKTKIWDYLKDNPTSRRIFKNDFTKKFWDDLKERKGGKIDQHVILFTWGETGSYKSGINIEIGRKMDDNFSVKNIAFTDNELLELVQRADVQTFIMRDEITSHAEYGIGSARQKAFLQVQAETLRANRTSFGYISPQPRPIGTEHYLLHCIGHNKFKLDDKGNALEPVYVLCGVANPITSNYLGGLVVEIEWMNDVWKQYWKRKVKFLEQVKNRHFAKQDFEEMAQKLLKHPKKAYVKVKNDWLLLIREVFPDLTTKEMELLYSQIKMLIRMGNV